MAAGLSFAPTTTKKEEFLKKWPWLNSTDTWLLQSLTETGATGVLELNQFGENKEMKGKKVKLPLRGYYLVSAVRAGLQIQAAGGAGIPARPCSAEMEICRPSEASVLK